MQSSANRPATAPQMAAKAPPAPARLPPRPAVRRWRPPVPPQHIVIEQLLLRILDTADAIAAVRDGYGEVPFRHDAEWRILERLAAYKGYMGISIIARRFGMHRMQAGRITRRLARHGLVELRESPGDRRVIHVGITAGGRRTVAEGQARRRGWVIETFPDYRTKSVLAFDQTLRAIAWRIANGWRREPNPCDWMP